MKDAFGEPSTGRRFPAEKRHGAAPVDYDPPINWNELYDIGLFASNPDALEGLHSPSPAGGSRHSERMRL